MPRVLGDEHLGHRLGAARPRGGAGRRVRRLRARVLAHRGPHHGAREPRDGRRAPRRPQPARLPALRARERRERGRNGERPRQGAGRHRARARERAEGAAGELGPGLRAARSPRKRPRPGRRGRARPPQRPGREHRRECERQPLGGSARARVDAQHERPRDRARAARPDRGRPAASPHRGDRPLARAGALREALEDVGGAGAGHGLSGGVRGAHRRDPRRLRLPGAAQHPARPRRRLRRAGGRPLRRCRAAPRAAAGGRGEPGADRAGHRPGGPPLLRPQPALRHAREGDRGAQPRLRRLPPLLAAGRPGDARHRSLSGRHRACDGDRGRPRRSPLRPCRGLPARRPRARRPGARHRAGLAAGIS